VDQTIDDDSITVASNTKFFKPGALLPETRLSFTVTTLAP